MIYNIYLQCEIILIKSQVNGICLNLTVQLKTGLELLCDHFAWNSIAVFL